MKRWTNGLPGAAKRLGANLALRGLSVSQSGCARIPMMARSKIAPLQRPNTLLQLSRSSVLELRLATHGRAIHNGTTQTSRPRLDMSVLWGEAVKVTPRSNDALDPSETLGLIRVEGSCLPFLPRRPVAKGIRGRRRAIPQGAHSPAQPCAGNAGTRAEGRCLKPLRGWK